MTGGMRRSMVVRGNDPASHDDLMLMLLGGRGERGATRQTTSTTATGRAPLTVQTVVAPVEPLVRLGGLVGAGRLADVVTGTPNDQQQAAELVETYVRTYGADAPHQLHELALTAPGDALRGNLSRAAIELLRGRPDLLEHQRVCSSVPRRRRRSSS